jgi:hypothetical protein
VRKRQAPHGTRLYQRLLRENRLLKEVSGDNTDFSITFIPKMNYEILINGYKRIINGIYSPKPYYERVRRFLKEYKLLQKSHLTLVIFVSILLISQHS